MMVIDLTCDEPQAHVPAAIPNIPLAMEVVDLTSDEPHLLA
jgi:hypothetical protein